MVEQLELFPPRLTRRRVQLMARRLVVIGFAPDRAVDRAVDMLRATWAEGQTTRAWTQAAIERARALRPRDAAP